MGLFSPREEPLNVSPTAIFNEQMRRQRDGVKYAREDAKREVRSAEESVKARIKDIEDRRKKREKKREKKDAELAAEFKRVLSADRVKSSGGTKGAAPIVVWHWNTEPPADWDIRTRRPGMGMLMTLPDIASGERLTDANVFINHLVNVRFGGDVDNIRRADSKWVERFLAAQRDTMARYGGLIRKLRDDKAMREVFKVAGLTFDLDGGTETNPGYDGEPITRKVIERVMPTLAEVQITTSGLELVYTLRLGDTVKNWTKQLDRLRPAFAAEGIATDNLTVVEDGDRVRLQFNDAPNIFPKAVASTPMPFPKTLSEAIAAYPKLRWRFGVDARGNERSAVVKDNPHVAIIAKTGWGKSILSASILENLRPYGSWMVFDGKGADHSVKLAEEPGVTWISKKPAEHLLGMKWLWEEMHERIAVADEAKSAGADAARAFDFPPIFGLLDEVPSMRSRIADLLGADAAEKFDYYVTDILQLGRQARCHLLLISQSLYVDSVPSDWQKNVSRMIFLGPVAARSMASDAFPKETAAAVESIAARIPDSAKGRGLYLDSSTEGVQPIPIQTYFDWAPGSTSMSMAPTDEVAAAWEAQRANLVGRPILFDRIGLKVDSPEWSTQPLAQLLDTPTVVVADEHGPVAGMEKYDLLSPHFAGKAPAAQLNPNRARGRGSAAPSSQPTPPSTGHVPPTPAEMTQEQIDAEVRRIAIAKGLLKTDEEIPSEQETSASPEPKRTTRKRATRKPAGDDDLEVGDI